jgi:hypothetical protein
MMRNPLRRKDATAPQQPQPSLADPPRPNPFELGIQDATRRVPDPAAESVVPGRRQPPANFHGLADAAGIEMEVTKKTAFDMLGECAADAHSMPFKLALTEGGLKKYTDELEKRRGRFSRLVHWAPAVIMAAVVLPAPFEVVLAESALRFTDLSEATVRLVSIGAVLAFEVALLVALLWLTSPFDSDRAEQRDNRGEDHGEGDLEREQAV